MLFNKIYNDTLQEKSNLIENEYSYSNYSFEEAIATYLSLAKNSVPKPYWIYLSISHNCNFDCLMCGVKEVEKGIELPAEVVRKAIDEIAGWPNEKVLMFTGGEPLLVDGIFDLIAYAVSKGIPAEMVSNGSLIDEQIAEKIVISGLQNIAISLDGVKAETHDLIRNKRSSYDLAIRAIKNLVAAKNKFGYGPQISVWTTIMNQNIDQLYDIALLAKNLGVECLVYHPVILNQVEMQKTYKGGPLWPQKEKLDILREQIDKLISFRKKYGIIAFLHDPYLFINYYSGKIKRKDWSCIPYVFLAIGPNGEMRICGNSFGNVKDMKIEGSLLSDKAFKQRKEMLRCKKPCLQTCWALPEYYSIKKITNKFIREIKSNNFRNKRLYLKKGLRILRETSSLIKNNQKKLNLREVIVSLTNKCNLSCKMCDIPKKEKNSEMTTKDVKNLIDSLKILNVKDIVFSGGEPLLRKDIFELAKYAKGKGLGVCITTNGILFNDYLASKFKEIGIKVLNISLDGNEEIHDFLRRKGTFQKVINAIITAKAYSLNITLATIVTKYNYKMLPFIIRLANQFKIDTVKIQPFSQIFLNKKHREFYIDNDEIDNCQQVIQEFIRLANEFDIKINPKNYLNKIPGYLANERVKAPQSFCKSLYISSAIDSNGNVYPCWNINKSFGNIKDKDFYSIWTGGKRDRFISEFNRNGCSGCLMSCYDTVYEKPHLISIWKLGQKTSNFISEISENFMDTISFGKYHEFIIKLLASKIENYEERCHAKYNSMHSNR
jgi:MoaA/NifB/PqqE/SkfB family radical SAM enzyme